MPATLPHVRGGKVKALAVTSAARTKLLPDLPTVIEAGVPGFEVDAWFGLAAPAATPQAIITRVHADAVRVLNQPDVRDKLVAEGSELVGNSSAEFTAFLKNDMAKWAKVVRQSGIRPE